MLLRTRRFCIVTAVVLAFLLSACGYEIKREVDYSEMARIGFTTKVFGDFVDMNLDFELIDTDSLYQGAIFLCVSLVDFGSTTEELIDEMVAQMPPSMSEADRIFYRQVLSDVVVPAAERYLCPEYASINI